MKKPMGLAAGILIPALIVVAVTAPSSAQAQTWPSKPIRIVIAQALYAFGASLCVISTYWSIGFIVLVQLNYAIAPRLPGRSKS